MRERIEPRTLKGFRDTMPGEALVRNRMFRTIEGVFESFGYGPIDPPALEYSQILKGKEFFDAASFPVATFRSSDVKPLSDKTARVTGDLTIAGKTSQVVLEVTWNFAGEHPLSKINPAYTDQYYAGFSVKTQLLRSDWGITRTIPYVSDEIQIGIETELKRTSGGASAGAGPGEGIPARN